MITFKRAGVEEPENTKKNRSKKVKKFNAFNKADRRNVKRQLKRY